MKTVLATIALIVLTVSCNQEITFESPQPKCKDKINLLGDGTASSPYIVCSSKHLKLLDDYLSDADVNIQNKYKDAYYKQTDHITLKAEDTVNFPIGNSSFEFTERIDPNVIFSELPNIDYSFNGIYDGQGYTITGLTMTKAGADDILGLFDSLGADSIIKNLKLKNFNINLADSIMFGSLAGASAGKVENVSVSNINITTTSGTGIAGLIGYYTGLEAKDISVSGSIINNGLSTNELSAGVISIILAAVPMNFTNITNRADITSPNGRIGGVSSVILGKVIATNLINTGTIQGQEASGIIDQGMNGSLYGLGNTPPELLNITNSGQIISNDSASGIIGRLIGGSAQTLLNKGQITAAINATGIAENIDSSTFSDIINTGEITGDDRASGIFRNAVSSNLSDIKNTGNITSKKDAIGLINQAQNITLEKCYTTGNIQVTNDYTNEWGNASGLIGAIYDSGGTVTIDNCFVSGTIQTPNNVSNSAAFVADLWQFDGNLSISNSYSSATIIGGRITEGTLIGGNSGDINAAAVINLANSVYYIQSLDRSGDIGSNGLPVGFTSAAVEIQQADLSDANNFPAFDFVNDWKIQNGQPRLK